MSDRNIQLRQFMTESLDFPTLRDADIRHRMRRCDEEAVASAIRFQTCRDKRLISPVVIGVLHRFVEPGIRRLLDQPKDQLRLVEDLGIDSLLMVEIVMLLEEVFEISVANDELREVRTLGDVRMLCESQACRIKCRPEVSATGG